MTEDTSRTSKTASKDVLPKLIPRILCCNNEASSFALGLGLAGSTPACICSMCSEFEQRISAWCRHLRGSFFLSASAT